MKSCQEPHLVIDFRCQQIQNRVRRKVRLFLIILQGPKHAVILHIVAVEDGIAALETPIAAAVQEDGSGRVIGAIYHPAQVMFVVFPLNHWVLDHGTGAVNPSHHIRIFLLQGSKIHRNGGSPFRLFPRPCRRVLRSPS